LNDVTLLCPVFDAAGKLMFFPAVRAHWVDVGGMVPGSYSGLSTNVYQEGVRIPPIKIISRGQIDRAAMTLLMANMRVPEEREGDFHASLGACKVAEQRIHGVVAKYGMDKVREAVRINLDRTERRLRDRIRELPDGDYVFEDYLEFYNQGRLDPVLARIKLTVAGDQLIADFEGTNPQVPGVVNCSLAVAGAGVFVAVKATLDPGGAVNEGAFRPITLKAPEASIFDVRNDAPAGAHGEVRKRAVSLTMGALAQVIPDLVCGDLCGSSFPNAIGGWNRRRNRQYVYYESPAGGNGGFAGGDGPSAFVNIDFGNLPSIHNVESIENEMPLLVESCALRIDGGGEGRQRGGVGMVRRIRVLDDEASYSVLSDRAVLPPWGVHGAGSAAPYHLSIERGADIIEFDTPGKVTGYPVYRDDVVVMRSSGGGGYGDPLERDADLVRRDVSFGVVSAERAASGYGVVLDASGAVDGSATEAERSSIRRLRRYLRVVADDTIDAYAGAKGKRRVVRLAAQDAADLGAGNYDLAELLGANPAPLRGWVRIEDGPPGEVRLDAFARRVLRCEDGDTVRITRLAMPKLPKGMAG
jgi:N-methylhydantoinase B